jgi:hypothetical protein
MNPDFVVDEGEVEVFNVVLIDRLSFRRDPIQPAAIRMIS